MKKRMFSVPYNNSNADDYLYAIHPFKNNIDSIYFGVPSLSINRNQYLYNEDNVEQNTLDFLSKEIFCKRFLALNEPSYHMSDNESYKFCKEDVFPILDQYNIEGVILSEYNMAKYIHKYRSDIKISTSVNSFMYNTRSMELWKDYCGATEFCPTRDILRTPDLLKKMHDAGFTLKCMVNESCRYGCPQQMTHCFGNVRRTTPNPIYYACANMKEDAILKCNWILPRWLKKLDEYVDIYKIVGRGASTDQIVSMLDAYINERDDICIDNFIYGGVARGNHINFPTNIIPDKLLTCECLDCKTCNICSELASQYSNNEIEEESI